MLGASLVRPRAATVCGLLCVLALAGCATQTKSAVTVSGTTLTIYLSQPPRAGGGETAADVLHAEQLALRQAGTKVGQFTLRVHAPLQGAELSDNARTAVQDKSAIAYLGEIGPGTSQDTVPITNELGLLQVSPADTAVYLTQSTRRSPARRAPSIRRARPTTRPLRAWSPTAPRRPRRSRPRCTRSACPSCTSQTTGPLRRLHRGRGAHRRRQAGTRDRLERRRRRRRLLRRQRLLDRAQGAGPGGRRGLGQAVRPVGALRRRLRRPLPAGAQRNLYVSSPGFAPSDLAPPGGTFVTAFTGAYGHAPVPEAIFGYEAAVRADSGPQGGRERRPASRATVVNDFRNLHNRQSVLGTYSISSGDTNIAPFVFGRVRGGRLVATAQG